MKETTDTPLVFRRRISNVDKQTCWLNSCLQLVLNGLDHTSDSELESQLGRELRTAQSVNFVNPTNIKVLLQHEINLNSERLQRQNILTGQQCARDFFITLSENKESWLDIYNLFQHTTEQKLECPYCKRESKYFSSELYREMVCPPDGSKLKNFLQLQLNCVDNVDFLCEDGCHRRGLFKKKLKIVTQESSNFLVVILTRGLDNYNNKVTVTDNVTIEDNENKKITFEPIAVVEHEGHISESGLSEGHYSCDAKSCEDENWYSTSDESVPNLIPKQKVTKYGYIILYKRK